MSDIICTSCNITVEVPRDVALFYQGDSDKPSELRFVPELRATGYEPSGKDPYFLVLEEDQLTELAQSAEAGRFPGYSVRIERRDVPTTASKTFDGTPEQAEAEGWQENEFGWVCPPCADTAYQAEDGSNTGYGDADILIKAAVLLNADPRQHPANQEKTVANIMARAAAAAPDLEAIRRIFDGSTSAGSWTARQFAEAFRSTAQYLRVSHPDVAVACTEAANQLDIVVLNEALAELQDFE